MLTKARSIFFWLIVVGLVVSGCSDTSEPTATFDGSACMFTGPSSLDFNGNVPFVFFNESDSKAGMGIWKVPDGTTIEDFAVSDILEIADFDTDMRGMVDASAGESATVTVLLDVAGDWLINCFAEDDYPALIFKVFNEESEG